jgi:hypothetical protein
MRLPRTAAVVATLACLTGLLAAGAAQAVGRKVAYGKPGNVQIQKMQGSRQTGQNPTIIFPAHWIKRSPLAPKLKQKICITFQVSVPATAPATGWVVKATKTFCGQIIPGNYAGVGSWNWQGETGVQYHTSYVVTWSTKKKKLAKATYDFNTTDDYTCVTRYCFVDKDAQNVPFISFLS